MRCYPHSPGIRIGDTKSAFATVGRFPRGRRLRGLPLVLSLGAVGCVPADDSGNISMGPPTDLPSESASGVDVLFVIDNRSATIPFQALLAKKLPHFVRLLDDLNVNYHLGVVTSDVGGTVAPPAKWEMGNPLCNTYAGDNGVLQATACPNRIGGSAEARNACSAVCGDSRFAPLDGRRFIEKEDGHTNVPEDLRQDPGTGKTVNMGPGRALSCMAMVGDTGCPLRGMLEGARRALDSTNIDNAGFLQPRSLLAVFLVTDEEDCSVQLARRGENDPATIDCAAPNQSASYRCYNPSYRCTAMSLRCNEPMNSAGPKTDCQERPDNYLEPTSTYVRFFQSLRPAERLVVRGLWALPSLQQHGKLVISKSGPSSATLGVSGGADGACQLAGLTSLAGSAQRRLSQFAADLGSDRRGRRVAGESSVCSPAAYETALADFAHEIEARLK